MHDNDRQIGQLRQAGIVRIPPADLSWCRGRDRTVRPAARLRGAGARQRAASHAEALAGRALSGFGRALLARGLTPVVVGSPAEAAIAREIPDALNLTGQTSFGDLADLGRAARFAIGNDTGPMHLLATAGCPSVVLFSRDSDPALCAPRGPDVRVLRRPGSGVAGRRHRALGVAATGCRLMADPNPVAIDDAPDQHRGVRAFQTVCRHRAVIGRS